MSIFRCSRPLFSSLRHSGVYDGVSELIGNTPIIKMNARLPGLSLLPSVDLFGKVEYFNPSSSVKDRLAYGVILAAEQSGQLKPGDTIIEATSGNTGIALAMLAAERGYRCVLTMSETFSVERRKLMRAYGAKVILTPAKERGTGMVNKAKELADRYGWFYPKQFETAANAAYHAKTTGPEIVSAFRETPLDYFITGYGTGGTIQGVGKVLRAASPQTKIVIAEPEVAPLVKENSWEKQTRNEDGSPKEAHPAFNPHPIEGWTPNFCPLIVEEAFKLKLIDDTITVTNQEAITSALDLARTQGLFVGISAGGSMAAALKYIRKIIEKNGPPKEGKRLRVLTMLPDTGERYHSTSLMSSISADMNEEEKQISVSTPGYQLPPPSSYFFPPNTATLILTANYYQSTKKAF